MKKKSKTSQELNFGTSPPQVRSKVISSKSQPLEKTQSSLHKNPQDMNALEQAETYLSEALQLLKIYQKDALVVDKSSELQQQLVQKDKLIEELRLEIGTLQWEQSMGGAPAAEPEPSVSEEELAQAKRKCEKLQGENIKLKTANQELERKLWRQQRRERLLKESFPLSRRIEPKEEHLSGKKVEPLPFLVRESPLMFPLYQKGEERPVSRVRLWRSASSSGMLHLLPVKAPKVQILSSSTLLPPGSPVVGSTGAEEKISEKFISPKIVERTRSSNLIEEEKALNKAETGKRRGSGISKLSKSGDSRGKVKIYT